MMKNQQPLLLFIFLALLSLSSCSLLTPNVQQEIVKLRSGSYQLDPKHTSVIFKISHMGLSTFVGRFNQFDASLDFDPKNPQAINLQAWVSADSIDVNNQSLSESLSEDWLESKSYPKITLNTLSVEVESEASNQFVFNAEITLLGVSKSVPFKAIFHGGANNLLTGFYTLGFSAKGSIKRSDFGLDKYIPMVGDQIDIEIYAEFQRK
jgi:polyisoprenoid-binding protein YceI